jgi:dTDP-4-dehydrorhamnose reductase
MRLLVTGAAGMLGQDVVRAAEGAGHDVAAMSRAALDITDPDAVGRAVAEHRPDAVINCAAYTDVDGAESDAGTAHAVNGEGAGVVATAVSRAGARVVHVSSDYVFDGAATEPYVESDPTAPLSVYGASKLAGEQAVAAAGGEHAIVRSSWLFGHGGRNFVETMLALGAERDEVAVVTDQVGCPTFTGHLAPALVEIAQRGAGGVMHVAAGGRCSWNEFAREIFDLAAVDCAVAEQTTAGMGRPAPRPPFSAMTSERDDLPVLADWHNGIADYIAGRAS